MSHAPRHPQLSRRNALATLGTGVGGALLGWRGGAPLWGAETADSLAGKQLKVHTTVPPNAEPELTDLVQSWITPLSRFYVRSHAASPQIDVADFRLTVEGLVNKPLTLSIDELQSRFRPASVVATMCCAGNRRREQSEIKPIEGVQWDAGAIGNAEWSGVKLAQVLRAAQLQSEAKFVWFEGLDPHEKKGKTILFGGSIPLDRAMQDPTGQGAALLATHMNHEALTADHGYPLRSVIPGYIGARSVKWLGKIVISDRPSDNYYVQDAYKLVQQDTREALQAAEPLLELPLQAVIATLQRTGPAGEGKLRVSGYALPPGDPRIALKTVEVSADDGQTWTKARITSPRSPLCWQLWDAVVTPGPQSHELVVRATDSAGQQQPAEIQWNAKGYMNNAWHRVPLARN